MNHLQDAQTKFMNKKINLFITLFFLAVIISAQNKEFECWTSNTFRFKINNDFKFDIENQFRSNLSSLNINQFFTQGSIKYENKQAKINTGFRLIQEFKSKIENHLRYHIDYAYVTDFDMSTLTLRLRFQTKNKMGVTKNDGDYPENDLRYRAKVKFKFPTTKLRPYLGFEVFQHFETGAINGFNKYRILFGGEYKLSKKGKLGLSIIREKQWVYWNPKTSWVFMPYYVNYIKKGEKKKKKKELFNQFD